jgi:hypothetical protein
MPAKIVITGQRFGKLKVTKDGPVKITRTGRFRTSVCLCDCGNTTVTYNADLRRGHVKSCGCYQREVTRKRSISHGLSGTKTHSAWESMLARCKYSNRASFVYYGGRGIRVCERWKKFENFLADMGENPPGLSLDRIDSNGNYSPENCRWATRKEQNRNTRSNRILTVHGVTGCLIELCEHFGVKYGTTKSRLRYGWTPDRAFTEPVHKK